MAKSEYRVHGRFDELVREVEGGIGAGSISATCEDASDFRLEDVRCAVRVFERYSWIGGNRVSLSVTFFGHDGDVRVSAIASGGSRAVFSKVNTFGEEAFLEKLDEIMGRYK